MKAFFIDCVEFSCALLKRLLEQNSFKIAGVVTRRNFAFNAGFRSLEPPAGCAGIPCLKVKKNDQEELTVWTGAFCPDIVFCYSRRNRYLCSSPN
jgi:methionyl-tRNA formyltransferase